jgi:ribosomal protein S18 acetylase RimI-like enzyme
MPIGIRSAEMSDIEQCRRLDGSFTTQHVWQMTEANVPGQLGASFCRVRIPRGVEVAYPRGVKDLLQDWRRNECFLVADELGEVFGYLDMTVCPWQWQGCIEHLVTDRRYRRQGLASRLLTVAEDWARANGLHAIVMVVQTKNDPAISLFLERGYSFCGYVDHYYNNGEVGLFLRLAL